MQPREPANRILDFVKTRVCSFVDNFAVYLRRDNSYLLLIEVAPATHQHQQSGRKGIELKIHGDGFLHSTAMICAVQDIIASSLRATWGYPGVVVPANTGFDRNTRCRQLEMPL
jgi:hypothetical protein